MYYSHRRYHKKKYYGSRTYNAGSERARRHIEEAEAFTREMGGMDQDVKQYFFNLSPRELDDILREYGRQFGSDPESYARETFNAWKTGTRRMSGLVAKRLFSLLPPRMPSKTKLDLADNIWKHFGPSSSHAFSVGPLAGIDAIADAVSRKLDAAVTIYNIPDNVKNRFAWLAAGDVRAEEVLLNHFRLQEKKLAVHRIQMELPVLQRQILNHPETTGATQSEIRIHKHTFTIRVHKQLADKIQEGLFQAYSPPPKTFAAPARRTVNAHQSAGTGNSGCAVFIAVGAVIAASVIAFI